MRELQRQLGRLFGAARRRPIEHTSGVSAKMRKAAAAAGCQVEPVQGGGYNVWPPEVLEDRSDPYDGDHYADNAATVYAMLDKYASMQRSGG